MAVQIAFLIRYSFVGINGWRSAAANDPAQLLDPDRLDERLALFRNITVPSLVAQSDQDFHVFVLSAEAMPQKYKIRLRRLLRTRLGNARCHIMFKPPGRVRKPFLKALRAKFAPEDHVAKVVLDDDDALAVDFVARLRAKAEDLRDGFEKPDDYSFVTFPEGLSMVMRSDAPQLYHRHLPGVNLGLTLFARNGFSKTPFCYAHNKVPKRYPTLVVDEPGPWYVRTIHSTNDSRGNFSTSELTKQERRATETQFPWMSTRHKALSSLCRQADVGTEHPSRRPPSGALSKPAGAAMTAALGKTSHPLKLRDSQIGSNLT